MGVDMWTRLDGFDSRRCTDRLIVASPPPGVSVDPLCPPATFPFRSSTAVPACLSWGPAGRSEFSALSMSPRFTETTTLPLPRDHEEGPPRGESVRSGTFQREAARGPSHLSVLG
jgi:hypothetical protein